MLILCAQCQAGVPATCGRLSPAVLLDMAEEIVCRAYANLRENVLQSVDEGDVHLIAYSFDHAGVVDWVVYQALQLREL